MVSKLNGCNISISDEKGKVLEWISPLTSRERHQAVRHAWVEGAGGWLLRDRSFSAWRISEDRAVKPILFCYGHPGAARHLSGMNLRSPQFGVMLKKQHSSLAIDVLLKGVDGGVAIAYVHYDFSAQNVQSASTV